MRTEIDTVVVGGGIAGLTAALCLSQAGRDVLLLEKATASGGRAQSQIRADFIFNLGPHAVYRAGEAYEFWQAQQFDLTGGLPDQKGALALWGGERFLLPGDPAGFFKTKLLSGRQKLVMMRALARLALDRPAKYAGVTVSAYLADLGLTGKPLALAETLCRISTYSNAPAEASAELLLLQYQRYLRRNVLYLDGGWQTIVTYYQQRLAANGVAVQTGQRVVAIHEAADNVRLELAGGTALTANAVIVATTPEDAAALLPNHDLQTAGQPVRAAVLDVALTSLPDSSFKFAVGLDRPYYYSVHSAAAALAPAGQTLLHVAKYLAPEGPEASATEAELTGLLDDLQPGWKVNLVHKRFLPHVNVASRLISAAQGGLASRQSNRPAGSRRIFLAGDWVGPHGWLVDGAVASGQAAAKAISEHVQRDDVPMASLVQAALG